MVRNDVLHTVVGIIAPSFQKKTSYFKHSPFGALLTHFLLPWHKCLSKYSIYKKISQEILLKVR